MTLPIYIRRFIWNLIQVPFQRAMNWDKDDKLCFEAFCRSAAGSKFLELLRQTVATTTFRAVYRDQVSENARARGMQDLLAVIHRLRSFPPEESIPAAGEDVEPLPSQKTGFDGRRFSSFNGGNSAIRNR